MFFKSTIKLLEKYVKWDGKGNRVTHMWCKIIIISCEIKVTIITLIFF